MLDVAVETALEAALVAALCARSPSLLATIPSGDQLTTSSLERALGTDVIELADKEASQANSLRKLQDHLFAGAPEESKLDDTVAVMSAPGEMHEAVEIARRIQDEARHGVAFDRIAVLCHVAERYGPYLEEALSRAGVPAYFATGTRRPEPGGRALLQLLSCASENLSAKCFGEYLSLAQVPDLDANIASADTFAPLDAEVFSSPLAADLELPSPIPETEPPEVSPVPVVEGTLKAPWRWEKLLVESAVIGSRNRWQRRLAGVETELRRQRTELPPEETGWIERQLVDLEHLKTVAMPIIDKLAAHPKSATWRVWLDYLQKLTVLAVRDRDPVLARARGARTDGAGGSPRPRRGAHGFGGAARPARSAAVAPPLRRGVRRAAALCARNGIRSRHRSRPGRADVPEKAHRGSDSLRCDPSPGQRRFENSSRCVPMRNVSRCDSPPEPRLRAAMFSYPRVDLDQGRPRVPSFYTLELMSAAEGRLPGFDELARRAACATGHAAGMASAGK